MWLSGRDGFSESMPLVTFSEAGTILGEAIQTNNMNKVGMTRHKAIERTVVVS